MRTPLFVTILISSLILVLSACATYSEKDKLTFDEEIQNYLEDKNLNYEKLETGMYYFLHQSGEGPLIKMTDKVTFVYEGSFLNGDVFQTIPESEAITFKTSELIIGWQDALTMVNKGAEISIILPPYLAYGSKNTELIPPNSIVQYQLKVLHVE